MSPTAELVLDALTARAVDGQVRYTLKELTAVTGKSRRSVQYALSTLRSMRLVSFARQVAPGVYVREVTFYSDNHTTE